MTDEPEDVEMCWHPKKQLSKYYPEGIVNYLFNSQLKIQCVDCGAYITYPSDVQQPMMYPTPKNARADES